MKKALIGLAAGAMALGASVVPVSAGVDEGNLWDGISSNDGDEVGALCDDDNGEDIFEALVLIGGWATKLDTDGNGDARYTVFQPYDYILDGLLESLGLEVSDLNSQPATVQAILADHIANGSFDEDELEDADLTRITMRSGYVASVLGAANGPMPVGPVDPAGGERDIYTNVLIGGVLIAEGNQYDNGWLYCINGVIDSTPQVPTEGLNSQDTPNDGTPGGTNSLPNTL